MHPFLQPADYIAAVGTEGESWPRLEALQYTRWLAQNHYENFHVASCLLPRSLRQDFYNLYAFCRWADDLGDEIGDPQRSLELLAWWRSELAAMYAGATRHPVFVALSETTRRHHLPQEPFADLIRAFVQDQTVTRYQTYEQLLDYCVYSANPVGQLVLRLGGYTDEERFRLSDLTCTALQLTNHWQDVRRDWTKGRVYLPLEIMQRHDYSIEQLEHDIGRGQSSDPFRRLMRELCERAGGLFVEALPLTSRVERRLAVDIELFSRGGMAILRKIAALDYDVIRTRPTLGKGAKLTLLLGAALRHVFHRSPPSREAQHAYR